MLYSLTTDNSICHQNIKKDKTKKMTAKPSIQIINFWPLAVDR